MTWRPILDGDLARPAHEAIRLIGDSLADSIPARVEGEAPAVAARYASLESGRAGLALHYAFRERAGLGGHAVADRLLGDAIERAARAEMGLSLCNGLAGVGWAAAHLTGANPDAAGLHHHVTSSLLLAIERPAMPNDPVDYDLLYGLVGFGIYALECLPDPGAAVLLERIVDRLDKLAERRAGTITWWTPPALTREPVRFANGWYNLGVAHGVPAVITLLALACRAGVAAAQTRSMLDGAVAWLLAQRLPGAGAAFPGYVGAGIDPRPARLGWCYGDLGLAAALLVAARAVRQPTWERTAVELALRAADRPPEESSVVDAPLCHGAIGVGHVFNRMFQASGERRLALAARYWLERGLAMRRPGGKLGGFHSLTPGPDGGPPRPVAYRGLLYGAAGIGLALLAATTDVEPAWDRVLLLS